jgi:hypothetical protein
MVLLVAVVHKNSDTPAVLMNGWYKCERGFTVLLGVWACADDSFFNRVNAEASGALTGICIENGKRF